MIKQKFWQNSDIIKHNFSFGLFFGFSSEPHTHKHTFSILYRPSTHNFVRALEIESRKRCFLLFFLLFIYFLLWHTSHAYIFWVHNISCAIEKQYTLVCQLLFLIGKGAHKTTHHLKFFWKIPSSKLIHILRSHAQLYTFMIFFSFSRAWYSSFLAYLFVR
jgi:hypothetical protein